MSTDDLIRHYMTRSSLPAAYLQVAIPAAIDAVYAARNEGGTMHDAGAAAAASALEAAQGTKVGA